ncbi:DUF2946 family protein [Comamonas endophytica]|uniref:DUF2946 domain-containing protein n=1 Tax=Comamonas endophytica TaxID=2949090 RepID=A0ABY6GF55_9BURK|nr:MULTISPECIES: hypothetical protein [unclassified Acidovorax]MCD2512685.1 hypothetical protein [Acidovorax sp. D4N7]UYG52960.1 hypothetical protein M9799_06975 [Acidovorax sp. 5MLIR]
MSWLRSSSPTLLPSRQAALVRACLAAWLLVLAAGLFTPWAQARGLEAVCSGTGHGSYRLGPDADSLAHALHGLDCPLCLPQLAAPPQDAGAVPADGPRAAQPARLQAMAWIPVPSACPPPARGPPAV